VANQAIARVLGARLRYDDIALISLSVGTHPLKLAASINRQPHNSATIHGYHTAMDFFRRQLLHE